jgi:competence protein ComEC
VLLAADVMAEAERTLLSSGQPLDSLVLKVPHHGGDTPLTLPFLQAVDPELAIISVGADNRFGHPDQVTLEKLGDIRTYRTDRQGSVEVVTDGQRYWVHAER